MVLLFSVLEQKLAFEILNVIKTFSCVGDLWRNVKNREVPDEATSNQRLTLNHRFNHFRGCVLNFKTCNVYL